VAEFAVVDSDAILSECGAYRYALHRAFAEGEGKCVFVMLNPSTADADVDDNTIRRCMGFAAGWGYGCLEVVNLYAFRATKPADLWRAEDPVGPENREMVRQCVAGAGRVVLAWGAHGKRNGRSQAMEDELRALCGDRVGTLGRTKGGEPKHPLYLRADTEFRP